jgi:hypothetical protein
VYTIKVYGGVGAKLPSFLWLSTKSQAVHFGEEITVIQQFLRIISTSWKLF